MDGTPGGWVVALVGARGLVRWCRCATASEVLAATTDAAAIGVDIPMGLMHSAPRAADAAARALLGGARSSVFSAPVRAVLDAPDYRSACERSRTALGKALSLQSWHIVGKIAQWDAVLTPELQRRVVEVHPELAFRRMAPEVRFTGKRTTRGVGQRIAALGGTVDILAALAELPAATPMNDLLDALAAAWSARRFAEGSAEIHGVELDPRGLTMRLVL